jgi:hypothetical protein
MNAFAEVSYCIEVSIYVHRKFGSHGGSINNGSLNGLKEEYGRKNHKRKTARNTRA